MTIWHQIWLLMLDQTLPTLIHVNNRFCLKPELTWRLKMSSLQMPVTVDGLDMVTTNNRTWPPQGYELPKTPTLRWGNHNWNCKMEGNISYLMIYSWSVFMTIMIPLKSLKLNYNVIVRLLWRVTDSLIAFQGLAMSAVFPAFTLNVYFKGVYGKCTKIIRGSSTNVHLSILVWYLRYLIEC